MGAGNLRSDVESQAESLLPRLDRGARKRLKQMVGSLERDGLAEVCDGELEAAVVATRANPDRTDRVAVGESVREQIGEQLGDARAVTSDGSAYREFAPDGAIRPGGLHFGDDLLQHRLQSRVNDPSQGKPPAQPSAREVHDVIDEPGHSLGAPVDQRDDMSSLLTERHHGQQLCAPMYRIQRIAQIVAHDGDELLPQLRGLSLVQKGRLTELQALLCVEMEGNQIGKQLEHADCLRRVQASRSGVNGAQGTEEPPARAVYRHRNVALKAVLLRRWMVTEGLILRGVINDDVLAAVAELITDGGLYLEFAARMETERDLVTHGTGDPTMLGHSRHRGEAQPRRAAHDLKDLRDGVDLGYGIQIILKGILQEGSSPTGRQRGVL